MVLGLFTDTTIVCDQAHSNGARFSNQETSATMAGMLIFPDEASIYTFMDLGFDLVDLVFLGGVWTRPHSQPCKLMLEFEVYLHQILARQVLGQCCKHRFVIPDELAQTRVQFKLSSFSEKSSSAWTLLFPFSWFFIRPTVSGGSSSSESWRPCWAYWSAYTTGFT